MPAAPIPRLISEPAHHGHDQECAHATDRSRRAATALSRAEAACRSRGARLTPIRRRVLEALHATHRPVGAYDIAQEIAEPGERPLAPITIYRALDFLIDHGFVHRLASRNAFVACAHDHGGAPPGQGDPAGMVAFLICEACGGVDELDSPPLVAAVAQVLREEKFAATSQVLEISGRCAHCRAAPSVGEPRGRET